MEEERKPEEVKTPATLIVVYGTTLFLRPVLSGLGPLSGPLCCAGVLTFRKRISDHSECGARSATLLSVNHVHNLFPVYFLI